MMILFNVFQVNWESPMEGQSSIAVIGIMASLCALLLYNFDDIYENI